MGLFDRLRGATKLAPDHTPRLTYRVGINETCRTLAQKFYGNVARWEEIYVANERILKSELQLGTDSLLPGTEITVLAPRSDLEGRPLSANAAGRPRRRWLTTTLSGATNPT